MSDLVSEPSSFVSKEDLIESFHEIVSEMQDTINEMNLNQCFLHVFDNKDITGLDMSELTTNYLYTSEFQKILMHLYVNKLILKNGGSWNLFPFPSTVFTQMYENIVEIKRPFQLLGLEEDDTASECLNEIECEQEPDWDDEMAQQRMDENATQNDKNCNSKFLTFFAAFFLVWYNFLFSDAMHEKLNKNENKWNTKFLTFFQSVFLYFQFWYDYFFYNDVESEECGLHLAECGDVVSMDDCEKEVIDWSKYRSRPGELDLEYNDIARCECTLIQSIDDLDASRTLLTQKLYSQSVFMSTQTVEKCLKSILTSYKLCFTTYFSLHCANALLKKLQDRCQLFPNHPYSRFADRFQTLCHRFESIGADSWTCPNPLSIRSRYFNFQTWNNHTESHLHYYVDSFPGLVYTQDLATEAYEIAEEIFQMSESIFEDIVNDFEEQ